MVSTTSPTPPTRSWSPTSRAASARAPRSNWSTRAASAKARRSCPRRPRRSSSGGSARASRRAPPASDVTPAPHARLHGTPTNGVTMVQCSAYASHDEAGKAVQALLADGVPGERIRVLMGEPERDAGTEEMGAFAGAVATDAPRGGYAGARAGRGSFAGDGAEQRGGSFADADREIETSYPDGTARQRV